MPLDLSKRLVVGVASSALFDLSAEDALFRREGEDRYRAHQRETLDETLPPGVALGFVQRLLGLNAVRPDDPPVEVVLLSRNDPDTGKRAMRSAKAMGLEITRAAFLNGGAPHRYAPAFDCELFLSANEPDVRAAIEAGAPAGLVLGRAPDDPPEREAGDEELRLAFDFDGVLADDGSEQVYAADGLERFRAHEDERRDTPLQPGPLKPFLDRIAEIQALERATEGYRPRLRTALVTARGAPAHERVATTLESWGVRLDEAFFLGGVEKTEVLNAFAPHLYFDDQRTHLDRLAGATPAAHVPFGALNRGA